MRKQPKLFVAGLSAVLAHSMVYESLRDVPAGVVNDFRNDGRPKTAAEIAKLIKEGAIGPTITALNGLMDKLPAALKTEVSALKDRLNQLLGQMEPTDQVPAAQEAAWGIDRLCCAIESVMATNKYLNETAERMATQYNGSETKVAEFTTKIERKELLEKGVVDTMLTNAKEEGRKSVMGEIVATRKKSIELCGMVVPGEDILNLPSADFDPRMDAAKKNHAAMVKKGFKIDGKGAAILKSFTWGKAEEFNSLEALIKDFPEAPVAEPLLGGGRGDDGGGRRGTLTRAEYAGSL